MSEENTTKAYATSESAMMQCITEKNTEIKNLKVDNTRLHNWIEKNHKHNHDHEYYHDDCGWCQVEKADWERIQEALTKPKTGDET